MPTPFIRVLGVALTVAGCQKSPPDVPPAGPPEQIPTGNPPAPDLVPVDPTPVAPTADANLPTWDSVSSGHPEGATNPPSPVLIVTREPLACYKSWRGGMRPPEPDIAAAGGRVVDTPASVDPRATQVQCPEGQPAELLAAWEAYLSGGSKR